ncbi:unnamed protein product, partial [Rotaria socialis]
VNLLVALIDKMDTLMLFDHRNVLSQVHDRFHGMQPKDLLPKDDRDGIRALYGNNENNQPTTFASTTAKPPPNTTSI